MRSSVLTTITRYVTYRSVHQACGPCLCVSNAIIKQPNTPLHMFTRSFVLNPDLTNATVLSKHERRDFMASFPDVVRELTNAGRNLDIPDINSWFTKVLQYNVAVGKRVRGLALLYSYKTVAPTHELTEENIHLVHIMAWCVEMMQAYLAMYNDIMSGREERHGRECWHQKDNVGFQAYNDAFLLQSGIFHLLRKYFHDKPYYVDCNELFHLASLKTAMGEALAMQTKSIEKFTLDRYNAIVKYKTGYYSYCLPVGLAFYMAGLNDPEVHRQAKTILMEMGHFFQIQNDYLDCFGEGDNIGTNIEDGKCTWLAVLACQRANQKQMKLLKDCYGARDTEKAITVKKVYQELGIPGTYFKYKEKGHHLICTHIQQISRGLPHDLFFKLLERVHERDV